MKIRLLKIRRKKPAPARSARVTIHDGAIEATFIEFRVILMNDDGSALTINTIVDSPVMGANHEQVAMDYAVGLAKHLGLDATFMIENVREMKVTQIILVDDVTGEPIYA